MTVPLRGRAESHPARWPTESTRRHQLRENSFYSGEPGHTYAFYSLARDLVGNVETTKTSAEANTVVSQSSACSGSPSLSGTVSNKSSVGTTLTLTLQFTNNGPGNALNALIDQIAFRTLGGSGTVSVIGSQLPLNLGDLSVGQSTPLTLTLSVPSTVTRFSITENGSLQDLLGNAYKFSIAQLVTP